jgi:hypothetical protein
MRCRSFEYLYRRLPNRGIMGIAMEIKCHHVPNHLARRARLRARLSRCMMVVLLASASRAQQTPETPQAESSSSAGSNTIEIPDATPIRLRFAQPVRGKVPCLWKAPPCGSSVVPQAKTNDTVRLVAAVDVRVNQFVVVAKGAVGQATVTKVWHPFMAITGLALQLDWIEDVTGKHIPLRIEKTGKAQPFTVQVLSTNGGMMARPETLHGDLLGSDAVDASLIWHKKNWIPAGTRIQGFVHGDALRDLAEVQNAQALLPFSNEFATLTIYRTKGDESRPRVVCDDKEIGQIGAQQFAVLELTPGKHTCHAEHQPAKEISVLGGEEYFLLLRSAGMSGGWEFKSVDIGEGEDTVSGLEPTRRQ